MIKRLNDALIVLALVYHFIGTVCQAICMLLVGVAIMAGAGFGGWLLLQIVDPWGIVGVFVIITGIAYTLTEY